MNIETIELFKNSDLPKSGWIQFAQGSGTSPGGSKVFENISVFSSGTKMPSPSVG